LAAGRFPIERGYALDQDDLVRRHVITRLMCDSRLDLRDVERRFGITFAEYFATELDELAGRGPYRTDGLLTLTPDAIALTELGRRFVRNVCMVFDRHLRRKAADAAAPVFSRTV
jgi:oxygen-independent coproporphyrinogen-3 oxidase